MRFVVEEKGLKLASAQGSAGSLRQKEGGKSATIETRSSAEPASTSAMEEDVAEEVSCLTDVFSVLKWGRGKGEVGKGRPEEYIARRSRTFGSQSPLGCLVALQWWGSGERRRLGSRVYS